MNDSYGSPLSENFFRYGWFDGIIQGRQEGETQILEGFVHDLNELGLAKFFLAIDGGRFSILADDATFSGHFLDQDRLGKFFQQLQTLPSVLKNSQAVESTLRATFVGESEVVETLFAPVRGVFQSISRRRGFSESDKKRDPSSRELKAVSRRAVIGSVALGLLIVGWVLFGAFKSGLLGSFFSPGASSINVDLGPLEGYVTLKLRKSWGSYHVELMRGPKFPLEGGGNLGLIRETKDPVIKTFFQRLQSGGGVWLTLSSPDGKVFESIPLQLAPLVQGESETVEISGRMGAKRLSLSLYPEKRKR